MLRRDVSSSHWQYDRAAKKKTLLEENWKGACCAFRTRGVRRVAHAATPDHCRIKHQTVENLL